MKFKRFAFILIVLIILISINHISAIDVNETDLNSNPVETDYEIPISYSVDADSQNDNIISSENSDEILTDSENLNHFYVSPDGNGNGSDENNPGDFKEILNNVDDNSIIHMSDGKYLITGSETISIQSKNNITFIADNSGKVEICSELIKSRGRRYTYLDTFTIEDSYNINFKDILFSSNMEFKSSDYSAPNGYFYSKNGNVNLSFENCMFLYYYDNNNKIPPFISISNGNPHININRCNFTKFGRITITSAGNVLINNTFFNKTTTFSNDYFCSIYGNFIITNSNFVSLHNTTIGCLWSGSLVFEDNHIDHPYDFKWGATHGKFLSHTTLTFLNDEDEFNVGTGSNIIINATLVDDYGNILLLPDLKFNIFENECTYNEGVYQTEVTASNTPGKYNIELSDDIYNYLNINNCTFKAPTLIVTKSQNITINTTDAVYSKNVNVNVTVSTMESGNISYVIKNSKNEVIREFNRVFSNNISSIVLDNLDVGTYTVSVTISQTEVYGPTTVSRTFKVNPITPNISVIVNNVTTLDNVTVNVTVPEGVTGQITIQIGEVYISGDSNRIVADKTVYVKSGDSVIITYAPFAAKDTYALGWSFTSNNPNFNSVSNNVWNTDEGRAKLIKFEVVKADSNLTVKAKDVDWGNNVTVSISTDSRFTGNITVKLGDDERIVEIKQGSGNVSFANLKTDTYNVTAKFNETALFNASQNDINVTVNKVNSTLSLGEDIVFDWNKTGSTEVYYSGATGVEAVIVETGTSIPIQDNTITVSNLNADIYTLRVTTVPDENHTSITKDINIKVNKVNASISLDDIAFDYNSFNSTTFAGEGIKNVTAYVLNQTKANVVVSDNIITVSNLDAGNYTLQVIVNPDDNHNSVNTTVKVTVNKINSIVDIRNDQVIYDYGNIGYCSVFTDGVINFNATIIGHPEAIIGIDESDIVNITGLDVGNYTLEVISNPDDNHKSVSARVNVTVSKVDSQITTPNIVFTYGESGSVNATIVGATGITNASVLNHTEAVVKIVNNTVTVSGLAAGSYVLQVTTIPDANHNPVTATANITVNGVETPASQAFTTNVPANSKSPTFSIKLDKEATGNFTVSVDGKVVDTKPLKDGSASITVANLAAGNHKISISYSGDGKYAPITQNTTLTIKAPAVVKKATKIVAKKKTFKAKKKVKKYTITLKSGKTLLKKVKVTLKVKGKTYKATTNNKGKATFKIKNLKKKGTYKAVIKFKGNKNYKASSKKVKIKVKK